MKEFLIDLECDISDHSSSSSPDNAAKFLFNLFAASRADCLGFSFSRGFTRGSPYSYGS